MSDRAKWFAAGFFSGAFLLGFVMALLEDDDD